MGAKTEGGVDIIESASIGGADTLNRIEGLELSEWIAPEFADADAC